MIGYIVSLILSGLIVGGLGRLVVPGPNPIGFWGTVAVGLIGSFLGGLVAYFLHLGLLIGVILQVAIAAILVYTISGRRRGLRSTLYR